MSLKNYIILSILTVADFQSVLVDKLSLDCLLDLSLKCLFVYNIDVKSCLSIYMYITHVSLVADLL